MQHFKQNKDIKNISTLTGTKRRSRSSSIDPGKAIKESKLKSDIMIFWFSIIFHHLLTGEYHQNSNCWQLSYFLFYFKFHQIRAFWAPNLLTECIHKTVCYPWLAQYPFNHFHNEFLCDFSTINLISYPIITFGFLFLISCLYLIMANVTFYLFYI